MRTPQCGMPLLVFLVGLGGCYDTDISFKGGGDVGEAIVDADDADLSDDTPQEHEHDLDGARDSEGLDTNVEPLFCIHAPDGAYAVKALEAQTGTFEIVWDVTPARAQDDAIVALSEGVPADREWSKLAVGAMFSRDDTLLGHNGDTYEADVEILYEPWETYRVRARVDVPHHLHTLYVAGPGMAEQVFAQDFAFRTGQESVTTLDQMVVMSGVGSLNACLVSLEALEAPAHVNVFPRDPVVAPGGTVHFSAEVTGDDPRVTWSVVGEQCGQVNASGVYTAGPIEKICKVRATSPRDPGGYAAAVVDVSATKLVPDTWRVVPSVADGGQFDVQPGPNGLLHLISDRYYQLDTHGAVVVAEDEGDGHQTIYSFPPAIAVGSDGSVHIVTRHGGTADEGFNVRYRYRRPDGTWDRDLTVGTPMGRNYVVGVAAPDTGEVYLTSSGVTEDLWGYIHLWEIGPDAPISLGSLDGMWRADCDSRLRARGEQIVLVSGKPDPGASSATYLLNAAAGDDILARLEANTQIHTSGEPRRGFADMAIDGLQHTHLVYGANHEVYYNQVTQSGQLVFDADTRLFDDLGDWHLSTGLAAIAVSDNGLLLVAVALRAHGDEQADDSELLWTSSHDGGNTWSPPEDVGRNSGGGEGRRRPRLVAIGYDFYLLYVDTEYPGISFAHLPFVPGSG